MNNKAFGRNIHKYRKQCGLTAKQLADQAGFSETFLRFVESGREPVTVDTLTKLCSILHISVDAVACDDIKESEINHLNALISASHKKLSHQEFLLISNILGALGDSLPKSNSPIM